MSDLTWRVFVHASPPAVRHLRVPGDSYTLCDAFQPSTRPATDLDIACPDCQARQEAAAERRGGVVETGER